MFCENLIQSGIGKDHIIQRRYTSEDFDNGMTDKDMYKDIKKEIKDGKKYYLLLDEVQEVTDWEKAINSLLENFSTDIYVTGSNSKLMSREISTYLSGRYVEIPVYTLSFSEYLVFKERTGLSKKDLLMEYIRTGGFPIIADHDLDERSSYQIVEGIYNLSLIHI